VETDPTLINVLGISQDMNYVHSNDIPADSQEAGTAAGEGVAGEALPSLFLNPLSQDSLQSWVVLRGRLFHLRRLNQGSC
jgi:hypothetical protein